MSKGTFSLGEAHMCFLGMSGTRVLILLLTKLADNTLSGDNYAFMEDNS